MVFNNLFLFKVHYKCLSYLVLQHNNVFYNIFIDAYGREGCKHGITGGSSDTQRETDQICQAHHLVAAFPDVCPPVPGRTRIAFYNIETEPGVHAYQRPCRIPETKRKL